MSLVDVRREDGRLYVTVGGSTHSTYDGLQALLPDLKLLYGEYGRVCGVWLHGTRYNVGDRIEITEAP